VKPWQRKQWNIPWVGAEFVWRMEDVLDVYEQPYDPLYPILCFDETPYQLIGEKLVPITMTPGQPQRYDSEYIRNGVVNLFMVFQPALGWRHIYIRPQRTKEDFAQVIQDVIDRQFPEAKGLKVVMDNLNTHTPASLYEVFPPEEARRLASQLEIHYTPKHASWLDMAEIEISVLKEQCLDRRIPTEEMLAQEILAWEEERNQRQTTVEWRFTSRDARDKLKRLYPKLEQDRGMEPTCQN
jgi:hypothetical protein